jgi:LDH2 family malate/lactate/ureidoglycolate dehydrogenase
MPETDQTSKSFRITPQDMMVLGQALLEHAGAPPEYARIVTEHLVAASAMGLH